jgi:hypothetical protein
LKKKRTGSFSDAGQADSRPSREATRRRRRRGRPR